MALTGVQRTHNLGARTSYHLQAVSTHGSVTVHIPRSFQGLLTVSTRGGVSFSSQLSEHVTTFSELNNTRKCFVGDLSSWGEAVEWTGDEVTAETKHGRVKVQYVDEVKPGSSRKRKSFLGWVLGL